MLTSLNYSRKRRDLFGRRCSQASISWSWKTNRLLKRLRIWDKKHKLWGFKTQRWRLAALSDWLYSWILFRWLTRLEDFSMWGQSVYFSAFSVQKLEPELSVCVVSSGGGCLQRIPGGFAHPVCSADEETCWFAWKTSWLGYRFGSSTEATVEKNKIKWIIYKNWAVVLFIS